jgi:hypothetical protein
MRGFSRADNRSIYTRECRLRATIPNNMSSAVATELQCESCGARIVVESGQITLRCLFCDAPGVVSRPAATGRRRPVFTLGFSVETDAAARAVKEWIGRQKMAPFGLKKAAAELTTGVYLPAYLYSATAETNYRASIAEKYEKFGVKDKSDDGVTLGNREETEYCDLAGRRVAYVADVLVTASRNVTNQELQAVEPFDLGKLRRYAPTLVAGWTAEEPSLSADECLRLARAEVEASIPDALRDFMPGDGVSSLRHGTEFAEESLDAVLVPVWIFAMRYDARKPPLRILVNGQTGKASGIVPFSWGKLGVWLAFIVALLAAVRMAVSFL